MNDEDFKNFKLVRAGVEIEVDMSRLHEQFQKAQFWLDSQIMQDMVPYMPMQTGTFIDVTRTNSAALAGTGRVVAGAAPMGRMLYEGMVMVDAETGKGPMKIPDGPGGYVLRFREGAKLVPTDRPLDFSRSAHPQAQAHWFEAAKKDHGKRWVAGVKKIAGGGNG